MTHAEKKGKEGRGMCPKKGEAHTEKDQKKENCMSRKFHCSRLKKNQKMHEDRKNVEHNSIKKTYNNDIIHPLSKINLIMQSLHWINKHYEKVFSNVWMIKHQKNVNWKLVRDPWPFCGLPTLLRTTPAWPEHWGQEDPLWTQMTLNKYSLF